MDHCDFWRMCNSYRGCYCNFKDTPLQKVKKVSTILEKKNWSKIFLYLSGILPRSLNYHLSLPMLIRQVMVGVRREQMKD